MIDVARFMGEWAVVFPDHPNANEIAGVLSNAGCRINYPSGNPWLIGQWDTSDFSLRTSSDSMKQIAVLGLVDKDAFASEGFTQGDDDLYSLDDFSPAGCFHLFASNGGTSRVQGTISGLRTVYQTKYQGITIAATRSDVLAAIRGTSIDLGQLAVRLLVSEHVLTTLNASMWEKVSTVKHEFALILSPDGLGETHQRWTVPDANLDAQEAGALLRDALVKAVKVRSNSGKLLSSDLSGGLDSTTLCFLASQGNNPLTTLTMLECDIGDDDPYWADLAASHLPQLNRIKVAEEDMPLHYSDLETPIPLAEEPYSCLENIGAFRMLARKLRESGSELHMTGDGGDETLMGGASGVLEMFRKKPLTAMRYLHAYRAFEHWRWSDIFRQAWEKRSRYPEWLKKKASSIRISPLENQDEENVIQMPPWATKDAVALVRNKLFDEAEAYKDAWLGWTAHHTVWGIRQSAYMFRSSIPIYRDEGVQITAPFLDDNVVEACMKASSHVRNTPWVYKPLLQHAMQGLVPSENLSRATKSEGSNIEYQGLRANTEKLVALCEDSLLEELGIIDANALRDVCTTQNLSVFMPYAISVSMSCERWLRDIAQVGKR